MSRGRKILIAVFVLIFIGGVAYALYPFIAGRYLEYQYAAEAENFLYHTLPATVTQRHDPDDPAAGVPIEHQGLLDAMREYNRRIFEENQTGLCDPWAYQTPSFDLAAYGIEDSVMGVVSIPTIAVEMPVYLGATGENMAKGAAHLSQTSLPIGGENTNCVLAGHCGWKGADFFRRLEKLTPGDVVTVTNLWETLTYEVTEIRVIDPDDIDEILIQPGRDMLTLMTCRPYASGGRYRLVVYCERAEKEEPAFSD